MNTAYRYAYEALPAGLGEQRLEVQKDADYMNEYERWQLQKRKESDAADDRLRQLQYDKLYKEVYGVLPGQAPTQTTEGDDNINDTDRSFVWVGNAITVDENKNLSDLHILSDTFKKYEEAISKGEKPETVSQAVYSVPDPLTGVRRIAYYKDVKDPRKEAYEKVAKKYGTSDITELREYLNRDIKKAVTVNRGAQLNRGSSKLLMAKLGANLLSSIDDRTNSKEVKKRIYNAKDKEAPSEEVLTKLFEDENAKLTYYPSSNTMKIVSTAHGNYVINNSAAFGNIMINSPFGAMPLDNYLSAISEAWNNSDQTELDIKGFNTLLELAMRRIQEEANAFTPEASGTSSKALIHSVN